MKIIVVDDEDFVRESLKALLLACKFEVQVAANGPQALEMAKNDPHDLFIIDKNLGNPMDGLELASALRELQPSVRIIIVSGDDDVRLGRQDESFAFLVKPFSLPGLLDLVNNAQDPI